MSIKDSDFLNSPVYMDNSLQDSLGNTKTFPKPRLLINSRKDFDAFISSMEAKEVVQYPFNIEYNLIQEDKGEYTKYELQLVVVKTIKNKKLLG